MCELLGMSANVPTDICFSFTGLMERGGSSGPHRDGWGIAFYLDGRGRSIHDPHPGADSEIADLFKKTSIKSHVVISHIRQANVGDVSLVNTHPFSRHFWGHTWSFAHNGELDNLSWLEPFRFRPVGTTDSELAFCWILDHLTNAYPDHPDEPEVLGMALQELCDKLRTRGIFNMILTDSRRLYAYCSTKMCRLTRRAPFGEAILNDGNMSVNFGEVTTDRDVVTVVATTPLTDNEEWTSLAEGELCIIEDGEVTSLMPANTVKASA
jgi:glutamine amidotransferase